MTLPAEVRPATGEGLLARVARWRRFLQVRPFDTATEDGRSAERYRRIAWSTLLSAGAKGAAIVVSFVAVPLVVGYLGAERYGMWLTISALIAVLGPLDLGIGNGLLQFVSDASGRNDRDGARRAVSTALLMLSAISFGLAVVFALAYPAIPWARLFNVDSAQAVSEAGPAAITLIALFIVGLPLSVAGVVQSAYQSGYVSSLWSVAGSVGSLAALLFAIAAHATLPLLIIALTGSGLLAALLNAVILFRRQRPWLAPRLRDFRAAAASSLLRIGVLFLVLQLAGLAAYQLDNFVIAQILGAEAVQQYAIPVKLFSLAPTLVSFALIPLWPAYREALARGDADWARRTLRRSIRLALAVNVPAAIFLVVAGPFLLHAWVGDAVSPTLALLAGLGIWIIMNALTGPLAMLLNGANVIGFQAVCATLMAICNVGVSVFLVSRIGVSGAVYGSIVAQALFILLPSWWYVPRLLARIPTRAPSGGTGP
jgi:O-antigen/teichoic acid export membrane protein